MRVEVRDEGIGIPPQDLPRMGEAFFTTKKAQGGTGLGLYVSRAIVEEHAGSLTFHSEAGCGTTVAVTLPAAEEGA